MYGVRTLFAAALTILTFGACAPSAAVQNGPLPPAPVEAKVRVTNSNWADMTVYAVRGSMRHRLGTVTSMSTVKFNVPRQFLDASGDFQLLADPVGSQEVHVTQRLQVWPGQTVDFRIENHLAISSIAVRD